MLKKSSTATFTGQADIITDELRLDFPATARNREAIWEVLGPLVDEKRGPILEVASGTGQHLAHFSALRPAQIWQGSDPDPRHRASIQAWNPDLPEPLDLDAAGHWPSKAWGGIIAINMVHISAWEATEGLLRGARQHLVKNGWLYLYGAYLRREGVNAPSNIAFDEDLRRQNPLWGVRDLEEVCSLAGECGMSLEKLVEMPANNFSLIFRPKSAR